MERLTFKEFLLKEAKGYFGQYGETDARNAALIASNRLPDSDASTRENIFCRWAKYYKLTITNPSTSTSQRTVNINKKKQTQKQTQKHRQKQKQKSNANILSETWNCRFPVGDKGTPCGLCKKCEKLNSL